MLDISDQMVERHGTVCVVQTVQSIFYVVVMLLTFILIIISILSHPHFFIPGLKPFFLQILSTIAFPFFFRTDSRNSPDCLSILLSISVFSFSVFFSTFNRSIRVVG